MVNLNIDLPESFFQEEERDGYLVSAKTKQLWAVQLDLLNEFDRVCKKHNIKYILDFGTLLGAVRHKGFIPWDDDVDVSMLREDYDKLMEIGPKEFKDPYFLQNPYTDIAYDDCVAKLRRSDTCFLTDFSRRSNVVYNQGIWIDIFVFDNIPSQNDQSKKRLNRESKKAYLRMRSISRFPHFNGNFSLYLIRVLLFFYCKLRYVSYLRIYRKFEKKAKNRPYSGIVGTTTFMVTNCRSISDYGKIINMPFENQLLPVPAGYDTLLRERYGDYMTPVFDGAAHENVFYDVSRSYQEVLKDKELMKKLGIPPVRSF